MSKSTVDIVPEIPAGFWQMHYDTTHDPNSPTLQGIESGANCQNFAYELLRHLGRHVPSLRSSNLWEDTLDTVPVDDYQPLDLIFNRTSVAWGAHIGVYVGNDRAIHLSRSGRRVAPSAVSATSRIPGARWGKGAISSTFDR